MGEDQTRLESHERRIPRSRLAQSLPGLGLNPCYDTRT
jgi:hypothetical protein